MSRSIDERVVSMEFDNQKFEKNIERTISSLNNLDDTINEFGSKGSGSFIDLSDGLSRLEIVFAGFYEKIGGYLGDLAIKGLNFAKSMSLDQITAGFGKYTSETKAAQAIVANTGATIDETYAAIDRLAKYTDETSYDFSNLTDTMTQFAMAGTDLKDAEVAVKGIGNWAALSGAGINEANIAMNALSKSISSGKLSLREWDIVSRSAKMGTASFVNELIATARESSAAFREFEARNGEVNFSNFRETAFGTNKLISSDILLETLRKYGDEEGNLGKEAKAAASEAKTLSEAINAVKDAVSGNWAKSFRFLFGNYEEARKFWTFVQNCMLEIFTIGGEFQKEVLEKWHFSEVGGWADMFEALQHAWEGIKNLAEPVADAFRQIFNPDVDNAVEALKTLTSNFKKSMFDFELNTGAWKNEDLINENILNSKTPKLTNENPELLTGKEDFSNDLETIKKSRTLYDKLNDTFKGLFSAVDIVKDALGGLAKGIKNTFQFIKPLAGLVLTVASAIGRFVSKIRDAISKSGVFEKVFGSIGNLLGGTLKAAIEVVSNLFDKLFGKIKNDNEFSTLETILTTVGKAFEWVSNNVLNKLVIPAFEAIGTVISSVIDVLKPLYDIISNKVGSAFSSLSEFLSTSKGSFSPFATKAENAKASISKFWDEFKENRLTPLKNSFDNAISSISGAFTKLKDAFKKAFSKNSETGESVEDTTTIFDKFLEILGKVAGFITGTLTNAFNWIAGKADSLKDKMAPLVGVFDSVRESLKQFFGQFKQGEAEGSLTLFERVGKVLTDVLNVVLGLLSKVFGWVKDTFSGLDIKGALSVILDLLKGLLLLEIGKFIHSLSGLADGIASLADKFKKTKSVAKDAKDLATALLMLAGAILVLSFIDTDTLANGLLVVMILLEMLVDAAERINKKGSLSVSGYSGGNKVSIFSPTFQNQMLDIAAAVLVLCSALKMLSKIPVGGLIAGELALWGVMFALATFIETVKDADLSKVSKGLKDISKSILIISASLALLSIVDFGKLMGSLLAFAIVLAELTVAVMLMDKADLTKTSGGLIALSVALGICAGALIAMSIVPFGKLMGSVLAFTLVLAELTIAMTVLKKVGVKGAIGMTILAAALAIIVPILLSLALVPFNVIGTGIGYLALVFATFAAAGAIMNIVGPGLIMFGLALDAIAASVLIVGLGLQTLGVGLTLLGAAIVAFGSTILANNNVLLEAFRSVFTAIISIFSEFIPGLAEALLGLVTALLTSLLETLPMWLDTVGQIIIGVLDGIDNMVGSIIERLITLVINVINALADSIDTHSQEIGDAVARLLLALIHTIVAFIDSILNKVLEFFGIAKVDTGNVFTDLLGIVLQGLAGLLYAVVQGLGWILTKGVEFLGTLPLLLIKGLLQLLGINTEFIDNIISDIHNFFENAWKLLTGKLKEIWDKVTGWFKNLWGKIKGIFKGKDKDTGDLAESASDGMERVTDAMGDTIEEGGKKVEDKALGLSEDTVDAFDQNGKAEEDVEEKADDILGSFGDVFNPDSSGAKTLLSNVGDLTGGVVDGFSLNGNASSETGAAGDQFVNGFTDSLYGGQSKVWNAGSSLGQSALSALKNTLGIASPSKETKKLGNYLVQGLSIGITKNSSNALDSAEEFGNETISILKEALSGFDALDSDNIENPVIKPVLDLSEIQNGQASISDILSGRYPVGLSASLGAVGRVSNNRSSSGNTENTTINMTVNGAAGQSVDNLADAVVRKINQSLKSRERVWA